jgi:hypothetical protein
MAIKDCEHNHHHHRRKNKTYHGDKRTSPPAKTQTDVSGGIACSRSGKALRECECLREFVVCKPASFVYYQVADLCHDGKTTAESHQPDFEEGQKDSAECGQLGDPL